MDVREWLGEDNQLGIDIWERKYRYQDESFDGWLDRVSGGDAELRQLIAEKKFLFGGRVLANRGVEGTGNFFNCFSAGFVPDDYAGIMDMLKEVGITFKHQGGQGISLTKLRPKGTPIGTEHESDGIIPFMEMFNSVTQGTSQGGARKGALMISLDINHKEAEQFIKLKSNLDAITKANLSLEIDDEFMKAVEAFYERGITCTLHKVYDYNGHIVEYDIVPIKLYKTMMEIVWDYGEPGCLFSNRLRNYNFLEFDDNYSIATTNPCGEQPLMERTSCCLGSINLYEFVKNKFTPEAYFDWEDFSHAIGVASNALDDIIDENLPRLPEEMNQYVTNAKNWRNTGLGVFNYAHALMAMQYSYGSREALNFTNNLFDQMMTLAIEFNVRRGKLKGAYPMFDKASVEKSEIYQKHKLPPIYDNAQWEFRNCTLLSIAPTGLR